MYTMFISDIHGSAYWCQKALELFEGQKCDRLILLGDLLYHGPRNDLPREYDCKRVIAMLNSYKDKIAMAVRGNCDAEVDQMVLSFPMMADYVSMDVKGHTLFITHGHVYNDEIKPNLNKGDFLLHGHFHVPKWKDYGNYTSLNPGSISIPKENSWHGVMTYKDGEFAWWDIDKAEIVHTLQVEE